ncbi:MAG TPA: aspartate aminotransferase family protein [Acidimicrobiia bacterium]|nr:aspartate aminotransferase family protein [Acidimicrobiia bacterium]
MSALFPRGPGLPSVARAHGCWIIDSEGNRYLDAASGALVVNVGHADSRVMSAITQQMAAVSYVHASAFTSTIGERYADALATRLPMDDTVIYPVSGGSEAVETALKATRSFYLAQGEPERTIVIGRELSYHGNTLGALDVSGRVGLRAPYLPWLHRAERVPGVLEYRCPNPMHPHHCARWHASRLEETIEELGPERVAGFIAEPVGGAASGAAIPPEGYWRAVRAVCDRFGVLLIADEVMTGFGRTGRWFASEHFELRPDIMTLAKGASSGYWPLGICAISGRVALALADGGFTHGFTFSHHPVGAAAGMAVLQRIDELRLVTAAETRGARLIAMLRDSVGGHDKVGDIRGLGLLIAVELVEDRDTKRPFPVEAGIAGRLALEARRQGLLVYPSRGTAGGGRGDVILVGPPLIVSLSELDELVSKFRRALGQLG